MTAYFLGRPIADLSPDDLIGHEDKTKLRAEIDALPPEAQRQLEARIQEILKQSERGLFEARVDFSAAENALEMMRHARLLGRDEARQEFVAMGGAIATRLPEESHWAWNDERLMQRFFADKPGIQEKTRNSYEQAFREFAITNGSASLSETTKADIKAFADYLRDREINRAGRTTLGRTTIKKLLNHVKSYFAWAVEAGLLKKNPGEGVFARAADKLEKRQKKRRALTTAELTQLFNSPLFVGCHSRSRRATRGQNVYRDEKYWFWILLLMTGARLEEIEKMPSQFVRVGDVDCFDLLHATKTLNAPRLVPILPELKRLGIYEWAAEQEKRGRGLVEGPNGSKDWSKWLNRYLDDIGLTDPLVVAYSLRHNFKQQLRASGLHGEIIDKVFGHEAEEGDKVGGNYGRDLSPGEAQLVVAKVAPPITLEHLWQLP